MKKAANLRRGTGFLSGEVIADLNKVSPGFGDNLGRQFNAFLMSASRRLDAHAGHSGSVGVAKQTKTDARGVVKPALLLDGDRAGGNAAPPVDNGDLITLDFFRRNL